MYAALSDKEVFEQCQEEARSLMDTEVEEECKHDYSQETLDQLTKNGDAASTIICLKRILIDACAEYVETDLYWRLENMSWMAGK